MSLFEKYFHNGDVTKPKEDTPETSKKNSVYFLLVVVGILVVSFLQTPSFQHRVEYRATKLLSEKLDEYLLAESVLPADITSLDLSDINMEKLTYVRISDTEYQISFTTSSDVEAIFSSETHKWNM